MGCTLRQSDLPKGRDIRVNGVPIPRAAISAEAQHHPARTPIEAWNQAAQALIVRELLLQEARRLGVCAEPASDAQGRRETDEEALIRALLEREIATPEPDEATCRRYYEQNPRRFRSPDIYEAAHILFAARKDDAQAYARAKAAAEQCLAVLRQQPGRFAELAQVHSACPSAAQGGNLGQITKGQTTPEFERALVALAPGEMTQAPVATRYGFHLIRLDRRHEGRQLPYELVAHRIADYLREAVRRRALAQYVARLAGSARIEGIELPSAADLRVN
ncbi:MAG TPA: peptidylprolyl isomerase [Xanthobacteraceae bacterium]|nr:peptidylprolyl isomerase [Xanthobacteraceae bacterium]